VAQNLHFTFTEFAAFFVRMIRRIFEAFRLNQKKNSMKRSALLRSAFCLTALFATILAASAQELVTNGGFETADFSGWTVNDPSTFTLIGTNSINFPGSHSGNNYALLGASPAAGSLSQTFNTSAGESYNISFWLASDRTTTVDNSFQVLWNGVSIFSQVNVPAPGFTNSYANFTFTNAAAGSTSTLEFRYVNNDDYFRLDDVSVSIVPEASTTSLALIGFGALSFVAYRKTKRNRAVATL
jgi:hypothetical protein